MTLGPLLSVFFFLWNQGHAVSASLTLQAGLGALFFHSATFLVNDYYDYLKGRDRIHFYGGSRILSKGFCPPWLALNLGLCFFCFGVLTVLPVLFAQPFVFLFFGASTVLGIIGFSYKNLKKALTGELIVFLTLGPGLVYGFSKVLFTPFLQQYTLFYLLISLLFGWLAVLCLHTKQWKNIAGDKQIQMRTFVTHLGFDKAKKLLYFHIIGLNLFVWSIQLFMGSHFWLNLSLNFLFLFISCLFVYSIYQTKSFVSSSLVYLEENFGLFHFIFPTLFIVFLSQTF